MPHPLAIITGGCHRLGAAIAGALARAGWDLALHGHSVVEPEAALAAAIEESGARWTVSLADFAAPDGADELLRDVAARWDRPPRLLVNSASMFGQDRLETVTAEAMAAHHAVNCAAPVLLTRGFAALHTEGHGAACVVNLLDQRIAQPHGDQLAYTLSKIALAGFTRIAARELAPRVRVNAVAPGLTLPTGDYSDAQMAALAARMPLARLSAPEDIATAVLYLAEARAVTGETLFVDAGAHMESWRRDFMNL